MHSYSGEKAQVGESNMSQVENRSTPLWERARYTVYLRLATIASCSLTLVAASIALNAAMKYDPMAEGDTAALAESGELETDEFVRETLAVTGTLIAVAAATLVLQSALVLASKCSAYFYEPAPGTLVHLKLADFTSSCVLLAAVTASTAAEGVVAYNWARSSVDSQREHLFRAVAGSTAFGFLSVVLLSSLCIMAFCTFHSLQRAQDRQKPSSSNTAAV